MAKENLDIADKEFHEAINFANSNESENPNNLAMKLIFRFLEDVIRDYESHLFSFIRRKLLC